MSPSGNNPEKRFRSLEAHLAEENPILLKVAQDFRKLDKFAHRMGLMEEDESFVTQIPWWPLVALLGTFSAGKSTFINDYLGTPLQRTGNQAVDDKFSVLVFGHSPEVRTLPGTALNADPRFPFYQFNREIEQVAPGEGDRIDAYLQLKTCASPTLSGKILIDSPGFDADSQRTSTLRITEHIVNLSDLVLVFFDARHPEPGAMRDTLQHLVSETVSRHDSEKFLYILNQIDTAAREDNPEEVVASWQRALAEHGLTAGRFYTVYSPTAGVPIPEESRRARFEGKRDADLNEIYERIHQVEVERAYRIISRLSKNARDIEERLVPELTRSLDTWRRRVLRGDLILFGGLALALLAWSVVAGWWQGLTLSPPWLEGLRTAHPVWGYTAVAVLVLAAVGLHTLSRKVAAQTVLVGMRRIKDSETWRVSLIRAFRKNTSMIHSVLRRRPVGWSGRVRRQLRALIDNTDTYVQALNDQFTNPAGGTPQRPKVRQSAEETPGEASVPTTARPETEREPKPSES